MNDAAKLNVTFNASGDDPTILECFWTGTNHPAPDLLEVGRAKPRVRALCILLLLAKYQANQTSCPDDPVSFQVKLKGGTWICTIAQAKDFLEWMGKRFHRNENQLFFSCEPGSTHNKTGRKFPLVKYLPDRLSQSNLNLFVKTVGQPRKPLTAEDLIPLAHKLEKKHWEHSAIDRLYPSCFGNSQSENDAMLLAFSAEAPKMTVAADPVQWNAHLALVAEILLEKEFDRYREECAPFFAYLGNSLDAAKLPFRWRKTVWSHRQGIVLHHNCAYYAGRYYIALSKLMDTGGSFGDESFTKSIWGRIPIKSNVAAASLIFRQLLPQKYEVSYNGYGEVYKDHQELLPEARESIRILSQGLENSNRAIAAGVFFAQQITWIDFLDEVCWPFYSPQGPIETFGKDLARNILFLKQEAAANANLIKRFCKSENEFREAIKAGGTLLNAQSKFWRSLHRRLLALES